MQVWRRAAWTAVVVSLVVGASVTLGPRAASALAQPVAGAGQWPAPPAQVVPAAGPSTPVPPAPAVGVDPTPRPVTAAPAASSEVTVSGGVATGQLVDAESSPTVGVFQNPSGSKTVQVTSHPARYADATGKWQPIDTTLAAGKGGTLVGRAVGSATSLSGFSSGSVVSADLGGGKTLGVSYVGSARVPATTVGSSAVYRDAFGPGADLSVGLLSDGFEESVTVPDQSARGYYDVTWALPAGASVAMTPGKMVELRDVKGGQLALFGSGSAYDATGAEGEVSVSILSVIGGVATIRVSADAKWLADPGRVFPVVIDPTLGTSGVQSATDTFVKSTWSTSQWNNDDLNAGTYSDYAPDRSFLWFQMPASIPTTAWVTEAHLSLWNKWVSWCTPTTTNLYALNAGFDQNTVWSNQPALGGWVSGTSFYHGDYQNGASTATCPSAPSALQDLSATGLVNSWVRQATPNYGMALTASNESDGQSGKRFNAYHSGVLFGPTLWITYDLQPSSTTNAAPGNGSPVNSLTPTLSANPATDPDAGDVLSYEFQLCADAAMSIGCVTSPWGSASWQVPSGSLSWGHWYYWSVLARDASGWTSPSWSPIWQFATNGASTASWSYGQDPFSQFSGGVNTAIGNYTRTDADVRIATVGPGLEVSRTYNSLSSNVGAFGTGWSWTYGFSLVVPGNPGVGWQVTYPDGHTEFYGKNTDGSFTPPIGYSSSLVALNGSTVRLTDKNQKQFDFDTATGHLVAVTDLDGHQVTLAWSASAVTVTDAVSGRHLYLTLSGGGLVQQVSTDAIAANGAQPYTWKYYYSGNFLTDVCNPLGNAQGGKCTHYRADGSGRLAEVDVASGKVDVKLTYDGTGKVATRLVGTDPAWQYSYATSSPVSGLQYDTTITDPAGSVSVVSFNQAFQMIRHVNPYSKARTWIYDSRGFLAQATDENGHAATYTNDANGNVLSLRDPMGNTQWFTYDSQNHLLTAADGRSASSTDATYRTTYTYDTNGHRTSETKPQLKPTKWTYTTGSQPVASGCGTGTQPAGLLASQTTPNGNTTGTPDPLFTTTMSYDAKGNLCRTTTPALLTTTNVYDELGRTTSTTVASSAGTPRIVSSTTTTVYDALSRPQTVTGPVITNPISGVTHQLVATTVYDDDSHPLTVTEADGQGHDASRVTQHAWDTSGREWKTTDALGFTVTKTFDANGNVKTVTDQRGTLRTVTYDKRNLIVDVTVTDGASQVHERQNIAYDDAGNKIQEDDALGRRRTYTYDGDDRLTDVTSAALTHVGQSPVAVALEHHDYDAAGHAIRDELGDRLRITTAVYDRAGRLSTSTLNMSGGTAPQLSGGDRVTAFTYDDDGNVTQRTLGAPGGPALQTSTMSYDPADRVVATTVNGLTTRTSYDERGAVIAQDDPRGTVPTGPDPAIATVTTYDAAGRVATSVSPPVPVSPSGAAPATATPTATVGYDTFGDVTHRQDPRGAVTVSTFDLLGRLADTTWPSYTQPGGTVISSSKESYSYDQAGNLTKRTGRDGRDTTFTFDVFNRVLTQTDPALGANAAGVTSYTYDLVGNRLTQTEPKASAGDAHGTQTVFTYDELNRVRTTAVTETKPATVTLTTTTDFDALGNRSLLITPKTGDDQTVWTYDGAGEQLAVSSGATAATATQRETRAYDAAGRLVTTTDVRTGAVVTNTYDTTGRVSTVTQTNPTVTPTVTITTGFGYDGAGNTTSTTNGNGFVTTSVYDAANRLAQVTQPKAAGQSMVTSYAYDANGNQTRVVDGRGNVTTTSYTPWNQPQTTTEPSTAAHPALTDRQFITTYDTAGFTVRDDLPGGWYVTHTYDELAHLTGDYAYTPTGTFSAQRTFGWDPAGNRTTAGHPSGSITVAFNDRHLPLSVTTPTDTTTYNYDADSQPTQRVDTAGTQDFTWDAQHRLATAKDPLTGLVHTYNYNLGGKDRLDSVTIGNGTTVNATLGYAYDGLGRVTSETQTNPTTQWSASFAYDNDNNLTTRTVTPAGVAGTGTHTFTYDRADRLTSWTVNGGSSTAYAYDDAGNRTTAGAATATYDERNRLLTNGTTTNTWSARGTLDTSTTAGVTTQYVFDGLGRTKSRQVGAAAADTYFWDALDRLTRRGTTSFGYAGLDIDPVKEGADKYSRTPSGRLLAIARNSTNRAAILNPHGDLIADTDTTGALTDSYAYDPFGATAGRTGTLTTNVGFQGDYTDPSSGQVWMGARFYSPSDASFTSRDSVAGSGAQPLSLNRYTYAVDNPLRYVDPDGHAPMTPTVADGETVTSMRRAGPGTVSGYAYMATIAVSAAFTALPAATRTPAFVATGRTAPRGRLCVDACGSNDDRYAAAYAVAVNTFNTVYKPLIQAKAAIGIFQANSGIFDTAAHGGHGDGNWSRNDFQAVADGPGYDASLRWAARTMLDNGTWKAYWHDDGGFLGKVTGWVSQHWDTLVDVAAIGLCVTGVGCALGMGLSLAAHLAKNAQDAGLLTGEFNTGQFLKAGAVTLASVAIGAGLGAGAAQIGERISARYATTALIEEGETAGAGMLSELRCSFAPATPVLMADGTTKPIADITIGDRVQTGDPTTGRHADTKTVTATIHDHDQDLVDLDVITNDHHHDTIHTTSRHPFWDDTTHNWAPAGSITIGHHLATASGSRLTLAARHALIGDGEMINLTIADNHTYYVATAESAVLVHNTCVRVHHRIVRAG